jgi:hypothetical protein
MVSDPKHSTGPGSVALIDAARFCEERLRAYRLNILARVRESDRAFDFALGAAAGLPNVVRCVLRIEPSDYRDLQTMLLQGDFNRAFLVYTADDQAHLSDEIQSYPLTRVDELAASLA